MVLCFLQIFNSLRLQRHPLNCCCIQCQTVWRALRTLSQMAHYKMKGHKPDDEWMLFSCIHCTYKVMGPHLNSFVTGDVAALNVNANCVLYQMRNEMLECNLAICFFMERGMIGRRERVLSNDAHCAVTQKLPC